jgi:hypothetical protein
VADPLGGPLAEGAHLPLVKTAAPNRADENPAVRPCSGANSPLLTVMIRFTEIFDVDVILWHARRPVHSGFSKKWVAQGLSL